MDILVKNTEIDNRIKEFCSKALYDHTLDIFSLNGFVVDDNNFHITDARLFGVTVHSIWIIDNFINEKQINLTDKLNVLLSYIECDGCVLWGGENYSGRNYIPFLQRLVVEEYINEETNTILFGLWTDFRNNRISKPYFDITEP